MAGALMGLVAYGLQDIYLTDSKKEYFGSAKYFRYEKIPINCSDNYPYTFRLKIED